MPFNKRKTNRLNLGSTIKSALVIFLPLLILIGGMAVFIYYLDLKSEVKVAKEQERQLVEVQKSIITSDFNAIYSHLIILSELSEYEKLFKETSISARLSLANKFLGVARQIKLYDQIRFIDEHGLEIIRVNYNNGNPLIVADNKLQNKANRYYFKDSFKLDKGEIFVSRFDLNIEGGQIERPLKPMLRFGTPVFDKYGDKRGVLLLNYFGKILIDKLEKASENALGKVLLLNPDGYWLRGPSAEDEWGFMFEDRKDKRFQTEFPGAWTKISNDDYGQFQVTEGLFTHADVFPLFKGWQSSTGSRKVYRWKIVSFIPSKIIKSQPWNRFQSSLLIYVLIVITLAISSWTLAKGRIKQKQDQAVLRQAEERFRTLVEGLKKEHFFYLQDTKGVFTYLSPPTAVL
jgi:hypothetical protein